MRSPRLFYPRFLSHHNFYSPTTTPVSKGTTPEILKPNKEEDVQAAEKGVKVPSHECVISWDNFKQHIDGRDLVDIYGINNDDSVVPGTSFKLSALWTSVNDTYVRRRGSTWNTAANRCVFLDGLFARIDNARVILKGPLGDNMIVYFVSSDPEKFVIIHVCFESQRIENGRCPSTLTHIMTKDQRDTPTNNEGIREGPIRLNDIPWSQIEDDLKNCLGQLFVDDTQPQIYYTWRNSACPVPGTDAFEKGVSG
ncbi:uncharacterized protein LOC132755568 [Ruditapes philippinarum]|uniref:uncharacterized protein LOC132755568 n=1 Tax=Ruditapes philippinarum TaxID=129788 RepID=UPI00295B3E93|nr:uncharacterized protein LOC132755568 [Ruditapes philippinarum]